MGTLLLASTDRGLVRLAYLGGEGEDEEAVLEQLASAISPRVLASPRRLDDPRRELDSISPASGTSSSCRWTGG